MKTPRTQIAHIIADRSLQTASGKKMSQEIAAYLLAEGRVGELDSLLRDIQADWAEAGFVEVLVASAYPLTAAVKADIQSQMKRIFPQAKKITVNEVRDHEVIAGVRLSLADRQLDLSVEAKLNKFKQITTAGKD